MIEPTEVIGKRPPRGAWLYVTQGSRSGRDFRLQPETTIGRDATECDVIFSESNVSAKHACIKYEGGEFTIYDLASLNGTYVNGQKVQKRILSDDDEIQVGNTTMIFKVTPK